ncbi:uncharacterized protein LOC108912906 [Anoplophora glabripennis]|uniref:uncharacterized protein LOC108912906 n=1 Tax=Anoplophora glabripennis TaxID=217634 RepID=UPI000875776B|nr:uncharacterized protein LOC108912906 [Anoplophora glabripennis]
MNRTDKEPGTSVPQSPRFFRRKFVSQVSNESPNTSQGKVVLGEVEQKLKSMRQKRLDRLSTFVVEQSKLSEEREKKNKEGNEIEDAIMSMKQTKEEKKTTFKSIVEDHVTEVKQIVVSEEIGSKDKVSVPRTPKLSRKNSNESVDKSKQSSTKKFINKFNCTTTQSVGSSTEDLTGDYEGIRSNSVTVRQNSKPQVLKRTSLEEDKSKAENKSNSNENIHNNNPLLSPVGKQRKGIYLYERECKFLENEKSQTVFTFIKRENISQQEVVKKSTEPVSHPAGEISVRKSSELGKTSFDPNTNAQAPKTMIMEVKTRNSCENRSTVASDDKPPLLMKTFKRNSLGDVLDGKLVHKVDLNPVSVAESPGIDKNYHYIKKDKEVTNQQGYAKISKYSNLTNYKNLELQFQQNKKESVPNKKGKDVYPVPPKSPMPLPRRTTNEERILKKFQRNWDSLNEIIENDSDVDSDEIEDLKKTFEEVNTLLVEYCTKLNKVERKIKVEDDHCQKLNVMKEELEKIEEEIPKFRGLKRDLSYREINGKLSNSLTEINKIKSSKADVHSEKQLVLKQAENLLKILECRVERNENILFEVLDSQVSSISTNIFNITRV